MNENDFEYIYRTLERQQKEIEKKIEYHKRRVSELEAEYDKIARVLENMLKHK